METNLSILNETYSVVTYNVPAFSGYENNINWFFQRQLRDNYLSLVSVFSNIEHLPTEYSEQKIAKRDFLKRAFNVFYDIEKQVNNEYFYQKDVFTFDSDVNYINSILEEWQSSIETLEKDIETYYSNIMEQYNIA